jgi:hypothetical protein
VTAPGGGPVEPVTAPGGGPVEPASLPGAGSAAEADIMLGVGRFVTGATVVVSAGATFTSDEKVPPPPPTAAELDQAMVRIVGQQNARLSQMVKAGDLSLIKLYQPGLHARIVQDLALAQKNPWALYSAFAKLTWAYGKALELMVDEALQIDEVAGGAFKHLGGKNQADWVAGGALAGVLYDLTTNHPDAIAKHHARFYGEKMRVVTYQPPW